MKRLKLLYFTVDLSNFTFRHREYFKRMLAGQPDVEVRFMQRGGNIRRILKSLDECPDFIYIDDFNYNEQLEGLSKIDIPKGIMCIDVAWSGNAFHEYAAKSDFQLIFAYYRDAFLNYLPMYAKQFRWLPQHAYTPVFRDYGLEKDIDYLLIGNTKSYQYGLRHLIRKTMKAMPNFVTFDHPGYRNLSPEEQKTLPVNDNYAKLINRAKIFFTDDSRYKYPVTKYMEVPACNTLLLASGSAELRDLGFVDGSTFVEIDSHNFLEKAEYYLHHERERMAIARRGYEMVRSRHTTNIRVRQFIRYIRDFLEGRSGQG